MDTATLEAVRTESAAIRAFLTDKMQAGIQPLQEESQRLSQALIRMQDELKSARRHDLLRSFENRPVPRVQEGRYAGLTPWDLNIIRGILSKQTTDDPAKTQRLLQWRNNLTAALDSVTAAKGDEYVPTLEARQLWEDINLATPLLSEIPSIPMPSNPFDLPLDWGDVNFYPGVANVAAPSTDPASNKKTLTAYELVGNIQLAYDLEEEAVIAVMETLRALLLRTSAEVLEDVIINADTTLTNNINADGATISASDPGKAQWLIGFDGLRHLPLVDATGQAVDVNGALTADLFNANRRKMKRYGVHPNECIHVMDIATYLKAQTLSVVQTLDQIGPRATIITGQLGAVEGIPIVVSEKMLLTAADGKVTDGIAGTVGGILTFNKHQWRTGFVRDITIETERSASKRQNSLIVSFKMAMTQREPTIANATHTALQYNITGV